MDDRERISREQAKRLVHRAEFGYLVVGKAEQLPALGDVDPEDAEYEIRVESYKFGDTEKAEQ